MAVFSEELEWAQSKVSQPLLLLYEKSNESFPHSICLVEWI